MKLRVLNKKAYAVKTDSKEKGAKAPVETEPQFMWQGKPVKAGDVITFDEGQDKGISDAKEVVYRELAEPADAEAKKFFEKLEKSGK